MIHLLQNIPTNITINILRINNNIWSDKLILKCDTLILFEQLLTIKKFNVLSHSTIKEIEIISASFQGDINKINVTNWKSLRKLNIYFDSERYSQYIYKSILLHAPNLRTLKIFPMLTHPIVPLKISKEIKELIWKSFDTVSQWVDIFERNLNFFGNMKTVNHQFDIIHLKFCQIL